MIKRIIPIALIGASILSLNACKNKNSFKTTDSGLEYSIVKDEEKGAKPAVGDVVEMHLHIRYKDDKTDTTLFDSRAMNNNTAIQFPMPAPTFKGDIAEGFMMLTPGDSAVFRISIDSLQKAGAQMLPFMKPGNKIEYNVVLVSVKSQAQMRKDQEAHANTQKSVDDKILQDYFTANSVTATKTASGLYYLIEKEGTGATAKPGQAVTVNYTGRTMDGKIFDSNLDPALGHAEPFTFVVGQGQVIQGWDEGVALFKKGTKAKLFIPSTLAYGQNSPSPAIPADAVLMFDIEVLKIEEAAAPQAQLPVQ
jgi:FKBP-type peptidyl-prolyl cis-trans isomerase